MNKLTTVLLIISVFCTILIGCKDDTPPIKEKKILLSTLSNGVGNKFRFEYNQDGKITRFYNEINPAVEFVFKYLSDGRVDSIKSKVGEKFLVPIYDTYKINWLNKNQAEMVIEEQSYLKNKWRVQINFDDNGRPTFQKKIDRGASMFTEQYTYLYNTEGNFYQIDTERDEITKSKLVQFTDFDKNINPFVKNFTELTILNYTNGVSLKAMDYLPISSKNNFVFFNTGENKFKYEYKYNANNLPTEIAIYYRRNSPTFSPFAAYTLEYIEQ